MHLKKEKYNKSWQKLASAVTFQRELGRRSLLCSYCWKSNIFDGKPTSLPTYCFSYAWISGIFVFPLQIKSAGAKTELIVAWACDKEGQLWTGQGWRKPGSCCSVCPAMLWLFAPGRKQRGACAASDVRWVFVLPPRREHREGRLLAQAVCKVVALLQQSPAVKGKRDFDSLSAKLIESCQCCASPELCRPLLYQLSLNSQYPC